MAASSSFNDEDGATLSDINVVPLVDVVLVLLIVFMITVPAVVGSAPIKVDVPETSYSAMGTPDDLPLQLALRREASGDIVLYQGDSPTNEAKLRAWVSDYGEKREKPTTFLSADRTIPYGDVVKVIDLLGKLGLHKLSLDTKHKPPQ